MRRKRYLLYTMGLLVFASCRERYEPEVVSSPNKYLVVEGVLNAGAGATNIRLTRTFKLDDTAKLKGELNAQLVVEGKDGTTRSLASAGSGIYSSSNLNLTIGKEYRLNIRTSDGKQYQSDWVMALKTPVIDSIGWTRNDEGVTMYINAHDQTNNTRYYRWECDETWEINSYFYSRHIYNPQTRTCRERNLPAEQVWQCWKYGFNTNILLGSSARLQSDVIYQAPLSFIVENDEKLCVRYSILARQYALDKKGYEFYDLMKRNTESIGTVFDPQPSEISGNIKCLDDPAELVIGYISASTVETKRVFVLNSALENWQMLQYCPTEDVKNNPDSLQDAYARGLSPIDGTPSTFDPSVYTSYIHSHRTCVDCTARGGSTLRPSYW